MKTLLVILVFCLPALVSFTNKENTFNVAIYRFDYMTANLTTESEQQLNEHILKIDSFPLFYSNYTIQINSQICEEEHVQDSLLFYKRAKVIYAKLFKRSTKFQISMNLKINPEPYINKSAQPCKYMSGNTLLFIKEWY